MKAMLRTENPTVYIIPYRNTSFVRVDGPNSIQDMTGQDGSKPRKIPVASVEHPGIHNVPHVTMNPSGRKDYQIYVKLTEPDLTGLDDILSQACIVCVRYNDVNAVVYGLGHGLNWDPDEQRFWSDTEVEPSTMSTENTRKWAQ